MASSISNRLSREDYKKSKELEELRKTGAAPPELDEDGKMINPHIPQYIGVAPWYLNNNRPGLKHQYSKHFGKVGLYAGIAETQVKGKKSRGGSKWQKGSCENCGATTHKTKECVERPRKRGAKLTNSNLAPDEILQPVPLDYEGKRDRWNGYDPSNYKKVIEHYRRTDKERRKKKEKELDAEMRGDKQPLPPGRPIVLSETKNFKGFRRGEVSEEIRRAVEAEENAILEAKRAIEKKALEDKERELAARKARGEPEPEPEPEEKEQGKDGEGKDGEGKDGEGEKEKESEERKEGVKEKEVEVENEVKADGKEVEQEEEKNKETEIQDKKDDQPNAVDADAELLNKAKSIIDSQVGGGGGSDSDTGTDTDSDTDASDDDGDSDPDDLKDGIGAVIQKRDARTRTTVRNLRIREDTAKYLRNLNINSAHYDPKTRSMRENPHPEKNPEELLYAGDNFVRRTGDVSKIAALQQFVWEATDRGNTDVHPLSNPSQSELLFEQFKQRKDSLKKEKQKSVLEKYGGEEHLEAPDRQLLLGESEAYVEYAQTGEVIKGQEKAIPKTKYVEDILENNHTEIWGSFWKEGKWGYACCQQTLRNAYCTGEDGKALVHTEPVGRLLPPVPTFSAHQLVELSSKPLSNAVGKKKRKKGDDENADGVKKKKNRKDKKEIVNGHDLPTEDDMEKYHRNKHIAGDPMANYVDTAA